MNILVIGKDDVFTLWVTVALASSGHRVCVMAPGGNRVARLSRHCRAYRACDAEIPQHPDPAFMAGLSAYCREQKIDWIVPADLPPTLLLARWERDPDAPRIFPCSRPELIERLNDKWEFHRLLGELGLPTPRTRLLESAVGVDRRPPDVPLILKPVRGEGGRGILRVDSPAGLPATLDRHAAEHRWPLVAQEYVPGQDIDLSVLADHGRIVAWTIQRRSASRPSTIEFLQHPRVLELGSELIRAVGYHGIVHFDLRIDERTGQPLFIEANPRFWGSLRHSVWSGVNFPALGIEMARGEDVGRRFKPVEGPCRDPGFSFRSVAVALLRGRRRPEEWSTATEAGWWCHLTDPLPEAWMRVRKLLPGSTDAPAPAL